MPNISQSKNNQTMKIGHLIEYNTRNILLEKSRTKWDGETIPGETTPEICPKLGISLEQ